MLDATAPLLAIQVIGTPRSKGSMRPFITKDGKPRMREQHGHSSDWRAAVVDAAHWAIRCDCPDPGCTALRPGFPCEAPVVAQLAFLFARPKTPRWPLPATRAVGDLDKLIRNILDALVDAGVLRDDSQVVELAVRKRYTDGAAGAGITLWPADLVPHESPVPGDVTRAPSPGSGVQQSTLPIEAGLL